MLVLFQLLQETTYLLYIGEHLVSFLSCNNMNDRNLQTCQQNWWHSVAKQHEGHGMEEGRERVVETGVGEG